MGWKQQADKLWQRIHSGTKIRLNFWLDTSVHEEADIAAMVYYLKYGGEGSPGRIFAKTIRDGIRLVWSLRRGDLNVLFELFPWVQAEFAGRAGATVGQSPKLTSQLERIEQLLLEQHYQPIPEEQGSIKRLDVGSFSPPSFEDDDDLPVLEVKKATASGGTATQNFLNSLQALQQ